MNYSVLSLVLIVLITFSQYVILRNKFAAFRVNSKKQFDDLNAQVQKFQTDLAGKQKERDDIELHKNQVQQEKDTIAAEKWTLDEKVKTLEAEKWTLDEKVKALEAEKWTLGEKIKTLETEKWTLGEKVKAAEAAGAQNQVADAKAA